MPSDASRMTQRSAAATQKLPHGDPFLSCVRPSSSCAAHAASRTPAPAPRADLPRHVPCTPPVALRPLRRVRAFRTTRAGTAYRFLPRLPRFCHICKTLCTLRCFIACAMARAPESSALAQVCPAQSAAPGPAQSAPFRPACQYRGGRECTFCRMTFAHMGVYLRFLR